MNDHASELVSVVIPVRNSAATVDDQLAALASQTYDGSFEVVVSDNGSTDDTRRRALGWEPKLPALRVVDASSRRGAAHARNAGIAAAYADRLLLCDGDDIVAPDWVEHMTAALRDHTLVAGHIDVVRLNQPYQYALTGDADLDEPERFHDFLPYPATGNLGMRRTVFETLAGFDETLRYFEDVDFGWRAAYAGFHVHYAAGAVVHRRLHDTADLARSRFRGGMTEPLLYRRHRRRGMHGSTWTHARHAWRELVRRLPEAARRADTRVWWTDEFATRLGRAVGSIRHRTVYL